MSTCHALGKSPVDRSYILSARQGGRLVNAPVLMVCLDVPFSAWPSPLFELRLAALGRNKLLWPRSEPSSLGVALGKQQS